MLGVAPNLLSEMDCASAIKPPFEVCYVYNQNRRKMNRKVAVSEHAKADDEPFRMAMFVRCVYAFMRNIKKMNRIVRFFW